MVCVIFKSKLNINFQSMLNKYVYNFLQWLGKHSELKITFGN